MANTTHPAIASLLGPGFHGDQCAEALRNVKNYIAGHDLRKRQYVQAGLIPELAAVLERFNTQTSAQGNEDSEADKVWIQIANIVCVLAHGGPSFVHPILHCSLVSRLVTRLSGDLPSKLSLAILHALNAIADNLPLSAPDTWDIDGRLAELLYPRNNGMIFTRLLSLSQMDVASQQIFDAAAALICKTCVAEKHKAALVREGVLAALCGRLASFVVAQGLVVPQGQLHSQSLGSVSMPLPAASTTQLSPTLETIAVLIQNSKDHAVQFLSDPSVLQVLPNDAVELVPPENRLNPWTSPPFAAVASTPLDTLLPNVPDTTKLDSGERSSFPPLGTPTTTTRRRQPPLHGVFLHSSVLRMEETPEKTHEYLVIPWLLYVARTSRGKQRLIAIHLLTILLSHDLVAAARARSFGTLLIPILIRILEDDAQVDDQSSELLTHMHYTKAVPAVLSSLIMDNSEMQRIAFDAKAIPKLAAALRSTFEQNEDHETQLWSPTKHEEAQPPGSPAHELGWGGPLLKARHIMSFREGLLKALAAIAPSDDNYRKEICDQGVLVQIMLALEPFQSQVSKQHDNHHAISTSGNSTSTLLAACNAVRALTRSVTALRTRLVDADVGKAIMRLMYNTDPEVRIAATKVIANLAMDFSPLKATISEPDLIKKLCEQAHSANARLRLESIWALKLLVLNAPNKLKRDVIDELGSNWIKHLIETDPHDIPPGVVIGLSERDYPPRAVHESDSLSDDVLMDEGYDAETSTAGMSSDPFDLAKDYNKHTVEDDLAIQEQLIDLIRNLFCGETASDIVDYLLGEIGNDTFMQVLIDRLRPRRATSSSKSPAVKSSVFRGIIVKVLYVIVHIAACAPSFRNMISANTALMRSVATFCTHEDPEIRVQCCWIIINLTYEDDSSDREACRVRALEINKIGFHSHMRRLENDSTPNVRERAKTAVHLLEKMM